MILAFLRNLWRAVVLLIGLVTIWFTIFKIYPYADSRLPAFSVLIILYIAFAYVIIPGLIRILRLLDKPNHIPTYAITSDGWPSDPVNIAIATSSREQLIESMTKAGWHQADRATLRNNLRSLYAIIFNRAYPSAPFSQLYLFGRPFDIGFEKPSNDQMSPRTRHHVRFWRLEIPTEDKRISDFRFWHTKVKHLLGTEGEIWIGAAIEDISLVGIRWKNGSITHQINPDTDAERDLIISDLKAAKQIGAVDVIPAGEPLSFRGQTIRRGAKLICDGTLTIVELRGSQKN